MMSIRTTLQSALFTLAALLISICQAAFAAPTVGKIEALQLPAWLTRGGLTVPATPSTPLQVGDELRTGKGARMLLQLNEGSAVRLGENATFVIAAAERKSGVFSAALSVVEGAFRFTTKALAKAQQRDVRIRVANNATIGIRGTDLWGRGRGDKDIVCLIEGKIDVTGNNNRTLRLDQPLQFFQSTRTAPPEPIGFIDPKLLSQWALETDIAEGRGTSANGNWKIVIDGFASRNDLLAMSRLLRESGYATDKTANNSLTIGQIASEMDANDLAAKLKQDFQLNAVKVVR
jgi:FecR protein